MNRFIILSLLAALSGLAKENLPLSEFSGQAIIKSEHDYVAISIRIHTECAKSPRDAQVATDEVVEKISDYLHSFKTSDDKYFKIIVDGGFSSPYSRWFKDREVCRNTFQKVTAI